MIRFTFQAPVYNFPADGGGFLEDRMWRSNPDLFLSQKTVSVTEDWPEDKAEKVFRVLMRLKRPFSVEYVNPP